MYYILYEHKEHQADRYYYSLRIPYDTVDVCVY